MIKFKPFIVLGAILFSITLLLPAILVLPFISERGNDTTAPPAEETPAENTGPAVEVSIYREEQKKIEKVDLEDYVAGVVANEMNASFEPEALKAQALAARTYIVRRMISETESGLPDGAVVGDSITYQVYKNKEELKTTWQSKDYDWKMKKIEDAVQATAGQILTYDGQPIDALFFSTSNGYTENSNDVWANSVAYLKSVESPWDKNSPKFNGEEEISIQDFESKLGVSLGSSASIMTNVEYTSGKRVAKANISGKELTGTDIRDKLGLKSTDFTMTRSGQSIIVTTKGYGHGVGMSQYGANGMAAEGKNYKDIVKYYYKDVAVTNSESLLTAYMAKK
ncbi:stage II sporulation protein D [Niallia taxi]|uniref:stage II sporulation protein D n=1 Tax=Niallia taxi TaxID=2499688 RepID=UPI0011A30395|nr:stage II sporulation protein D [Niallia taxi]MCT2344363.1 stage II sporulation protein D [Niallia taxi]MDE5053803.1 stage II sporulation protein D [Niallia taxi]MED3964169.1 stage II sporulation protein D [Niallia taxi]WOD63443.1 stage II sporulation protein D [Niallia taxi]